MSDEHSRDDYEHRLVCDAGERLGYGRVMQLCEEIWVAKLKRQGIGTNGGGAHSVGPCVGMLVPCPCADGVSCDWCCGAGRVTRRVAEAAAAAESLAREDGERAMSGSDGTYIRNGKEHPGFVTTKDQRAAAAARISQEESLPAAAPSDHLRHRLAEMSVRIAATRDGFIARDGEVELFVSHDAMASMGLRFRR